MNVTGRAIVQIWFFAETFLKYSMGHIWLIRFFKILDNLIIEVKFGSTVSVESWSEGTDIDKVNLCPMRRRKSKPRCIPSWTNICTPSNKHRHITPKALWIRFEMEYVWSEKIKWHEKYGFFSRDKKKTRDYRRKKTLLENIILHSILHLNEFQSGILWVVNTEIQNDSAKCLAESVYGRT